MHNAVRNASPPIPHRIANWHRLHRSSLTLLLALLLLFGALATPASAAESRVLPQLQAWANAAPNATQRVIVRRIERNRAAGAAVTRAGGRIIRHSVLARIVSRPYNGRCTTRCNREGIARDRRSARHPSLLPRALD